MYPCPPPERTKTNGMERERTLGFYLRQTDTRLAPCNVQLLYTHYLTFGFLYFKTTYVFHSPGLFTRKVQICSSKDDMRNYSVQSNLPLIHSDTLDLPPLKKNINTPILRNRKINQLARYNASLVRF